MERLETTTKNEISVWVNFNGTEVLDNDKNSDHPLSECIVTFAVINYLNSSLE